MDADGGDVDILVEMAQLRDAFGIAYRQLRGGQRFAVNFIRPAVLQRHQGFAQTVVERDIGRSQRGDRLAVLCGK